MSISSKAITDVQTKQIIIEYMFEETSPKNWDLLFTSNVSDGRKCFTH